MDVLFKVNEHHHHEHITKHIQAIPQHAAFIVYLVHHMPCQVAKFSPHAIDATTDDRICFMKRLHKSAYSFRHLGCLHKYTAYPVQM